MGALISCCKKQKTKTVQNSARRDDDKKQIYPASKDGVKRSKDEAGQDSYDILTNELGTNLRFLAIYDGHGLKGREASHLARDEVRKQLIRDKNTLAKLKDRKDAEKYFKKIFGIIQDKYKKKSNDFDLSGTCAICVLMVDIHCFVINLGDSRAVIGAKQGEQKVAYQMSIDHKADREDEKRRIESNKGIVSSGKDGSVGPARVYSKMEGENLPGLAVSRSFGDLIGHEVGITHEPEVSYKELDMDDKYMVIGSDGVWDVMNSAEVVGYIFQKSETYKDKSADFLVEECRTRWEVINLYKQKIHSDKEKKEEGKASKNQPQTTIDDITSVIYFFNFDNN